MDEDPLYFYRETGTSFCQNTISMTKDNLKRVEPFFSKIRTTTKARIAYKYSNKNCNVKIKGMQVEVELANHFVEVAIEKHPKDFASLLRLVASTDNDEENKDKKVTKEEEPEKTIQDQLEVLYERERLLKEKLKNRQICQERGMSEKPLKQPRGRAHLMLDALCSPGLLKPHFWTNFHIPFRVPLSTNRLKAMKAITTVTVTDPLLNKATRKFLAYKKILEFFEAQDITAAKTTQRKHFLNYFQLLSKLVFKHISKESSDVIRKLKRGLHDLKNSKDTNVHSSLYGNLAYLYGQIANPPREELPKMVELAQTHVSHLEKKYGKRFFVKKVKSLQKTSKNMTNETL